MMQYFYIFELDSIILQMVVERPAIVRYLIGAAIIVIGIFVPIMMHLRDKKEKVEIL